jgi:hypothetical protein
VFDDWEEKHGKKTSSANMVDRRRRQMRSLWFKYDPSATSQGWKCLQQQRRKHSDIVCEMSRKGTSQKKKAKTKNMSYMQKIISAKKGQGCSLQRQKVLEEDGPYIGRTTMGLSFRVDRLKALGNGQVPAVVRKAWEILKGEEHG